MRGTQNNQGAMQNPNLGSGSNFGNILRGSVITNDSEAKKQVAQYSLSLIKASLDQLLTSNTDGKIDDVNQLYNVMSEFNTYHPSDKTDKYPCSNEMLKELIKDHERIILELKHKLTLCYERYKDVSVSNVLSGIIEEHKSIASTLKKFLVNKY
jgi:hypothetical protein